MHRLAIYDMDRTITRGPTWTPFLWHATASGRSRWRRVLAPAAALGGVGYLARLTNRKGLKQWSHRLMLGGGVHAEPLGRVTTAFADRVIARGLLAGARARIEADRAEGYRLVLATASPRFYAAAIAERLRFDAVIATESVWHPDGRLSHRIDGENCYGPDKLRMIEAWLAREGIARADAQVRFYSDHVSDAPALGWADEAFAVNAHGPLRVLAKARGWPVLEWRR